MIELQTQVFKGRSHFKHRFLRRIVPCLKTIREERNPKKDYSTSSLGSKAEQQVPRVHVPTVQHPETSPKMIERHSCTRAISYPAGTLWGIADVCGKNSSLLRAYKRFILGFTKGFTNQQLH